VSQPPSTAKILLVDDHPANLMALEATLQPLQQALVFASSGGEAIDCLRDDDFALVLLDVHMPGLDGYDTCRAMRKEGRNRAVPVIFMTAVYNDREHEATGYAAGAVDYITKPFDPAVLRAKVGAFVGMHVQAIEIERQAEALAAAEHAAMAEATARRAAEEANEAKDHFLAVISHELRTPLNTMLGWAEMLRSGRLSEERAKKALETLIRSGRAQDRLIEDLLDSARIVAGKMQLRPAPTDLGEIVEAAIEEQRPTAERRRIAIRFDAEIKRLPMQGDPHRLRQVVSNLLSNAIKFSRDDGHVSVRLQRSEDLAVLEVEDDGIGIRADFLPHVFQRFRQAAADDRRTHGGLGLGLSIVQHLAELHGGTIEARSRGEGQGACFVLKLPLSGVMAERRPATGRFHALRDEPTDLANVSVLFVDDEEDARELVGQLLGDAAATVHTAGSVAEAMDVLERKSVDIIISDLSMPHEDGFSFARRMTERAEKTGVAIPLIALSAYSGVEDRERALEAGFDTHVGKPFDPARLLSLISALAPKG